MAKKHFRSELKKNGKQYEDEQIAQAVKAAEVDRGQFWKLVKKSRRGSGNKIAAIKDIYGKVISDIHGILGVWKDHFKKLYTPKECTDFFEVHHKRVLNAETTGITFLETNFSEQEEVKDAINTLHKKKACGYDSISTEHLVYGGPQIVRILTCVYNHILRMEYIPINLRRGIQIPLFMGKGMCCLEADNYRGISLLTNFNKVYEVLIWNRIKKTGG